MARSIFFYTDSGTFGGSEEALLVLIEALDRAQWAPTLLIDEAPRLPLLAEQARELGVPVRTIAPMALGLVGAARVPELVRHLRRERPDVFHAQLTWPLGSKYALMAAVLARVPAVLGTVQLVGPFPIDRSNTWQLRALAARVGRYLAVSEDIKRELVSRLGWPETKIEVVYNAVRVDRFDVTADAAELRTELTHGRRSPVVLTLARLDPQKGHSVLLEAAAKLPGVVFALAGDGPERRALESQAAALGIGDRVLFLGHRTDIPELLSACDVFALPSLYEGSSVASLEAMAAGCAIVSSAIPGTDELITDGDDGLLVAPGNAPALAHALGRLIEDPDLRTALGRRARARVERDFTAEVMARRVTSAYAELLGGAPAGPDRWRRDDEQNSILRRADWRFLLRQTERPRAVNLARGELGQAVSQIAGEAMSGADLAVPASPDRAALERARASLRDGGELYCESRLPGGAWLIRRAMKRAGFEDIRVLWPGPRAGRTPPEFWLPLGCREAATYVLSGRPARGPRDAVVRRAWRIALATGTLVPLAIIARKRGAAEPDGEDELERLLHSSPSWLLLTGGHRTINKVVALPFGPKSASPSFVVKFARVPEAEPGLAHEAAVLRVMADEHPAVQHVPRVLAAGRRAGRAALAETAVHGTPLMSTLTPSSFPRLATHVTDWLIDLARGAPTSDPSKWHARLIEQPLETFERQFGSEIDRRLAQRAREHLDQLGALPIVFEHRDCAPWNVLLTSAGAPALLDWESAEPRGLPVLDLVYFLTNSVFVLEGALESGSTRESYRRLLDPNSAAGRVAAGCLEHYCQELGLAPAAVAPLRLLTWLVHSRSDYRHLELDAGGPPTPRAVGASVFLGLVKEELEC